MEKPVNILMGGDHPATGGMTLGVFVVNPASPGNSPAAARR